MSKEKKRNKQTENSDEVKATWKDILAMTIAAYELLLGPMLLIFMGIGVVVLFFYIVFG